MTRRLIQPGTLCEILEVSPRTYANWVENGIIRSAVGERQPGPGNHRAFYLPDAVAALAFGTLCVSGYGRGQAVAVAKAINSIEPEVWDRHFAAGRTWLAIVAEKVDGPFTREQVAALMRKNTAAIDAAEKTGDLLTSPYGVDVRRFWTFMVARLDARQAASAKPTAQSRKAKRAKAVAQ